MKVDVKNPELVIEVLLDDMVALNSALYKEAEITVRTTQDDGMGITPLEECTGVTPEYAKTIKNLMKQNEKQRKWLDEKNIEIHCLNGKLADRRQQLSNHYEQNHDLIKSQRQLCDDITAYIEEIKQLLRVEEISNIPIYLRNMEKTIAVFRTYQTSKSLPEVPAGEPVPESCAREGVAESDHNAGG